MSDLFWMTDAQMARAFGNIFTNRNSLGWRDTPHKTLYYSCWKRWSEKGIFARTLLELADQGGATDTLMIDLPISRYTARPPACGAKRGARSADRADQGWHEHQTACRYGHQRPPIAVLHDRWPCLRLNRRGGAAG